MARSARVGSRLSHRKRGLRLIVGPMFSGKTALLLDILESAYHEGQRVAALKPGVDRRYSNAEIVSHDGRSWRAHSVSSTDDFENLSTTYDIVVIDEVQFLDASVVHAVSAVAQTGASVVAAGLDLDFRGEPFPTTDALAQLSGKVERLVAVCGLCGREATHTQRLIGSRPAPTTSPTVVVGGAELYQPRCFACFVAERQQGAAPLSDTPPRATSVPKAS